MRFTGLGVGNLDLQARQICRMSVNDIMDYHKINESEPIVMAVESEPDPDMDMDAYCSDGEVETPLDLLEDSESEEFD